MVSSFTKRFFRRAEMLGTEFLRENGFIGYENGEFIMGEKEARENARYKTPSERLEQKRQERVRESKMSYRGQ